MQRMNSVQSVGTHVGQKRDRERYKERNDLDIIEVRLHLVVYVVICNLSLSENASCSATPV